MNTPASQLPMGTGVTDFNTWFDRRFEEKMAERETNHVPSMTLIATKGTLGVSDITELRSLCVEANAKLIARQMTIDLFGMDKKDFIPEIAAWVGAASFLRITQTADINLFT